MKQLQVFTHFTGRDASLHIPGVLFVFMVDNSTEKYMKLVIYSERDTERDRQRQREGTIILFCGVSFRVTETTTNKAASASTYE